MKYYWCIALGISYVHHVISICLEDTAQSIVIGKDCRCLLNVLQEGQVIECSQISDIRFDSPNKVGISHVNKCNLLPYCPFWG